VKKYKNNRKPFSEDRGRLFFAKKRDLRPSFEIPRGEK